MGKHSVSAIAGALVLAVVLALPGAACAYDVPNLPLKEKVERSDVVFIGRAVLVSTPEGAQGETSVFVQPTTMLKGRPDAVFEVSIGGMGPELTPDCCVKGSSYLFFLKGNKDGPYVSVNGPYGILPMDTHRMLDWMRGCHEAMVGYQYSQAFDGTVQGEAEAKNGQPDVDKYAQSLSKGNADYLLKELTAYSKMADSSQVAAEKDKISALFERNGKMTGYKVIENEKISDRVVLSHVVLYHTLVPSFWKFLFYRKDAKWRLASFDFRSAQSWMRDRVGDQAQ